MAAFARPLSTYFKSAATATINLIGDVFVTRIETDDGWYVEPPPTKSIMEAARYIKLWAGNEYEVAVIEDLDNAHLTPVSMARKARGKSASPKSVVESAKRNRIDKQQNADRSSRIRRCA